MKIMRSSFAIALFISLSLILVDTVHGEPALTPDKILSHPKKIWTAENYVFVQGRWKSSGGNSRFHKIPQINTFNITCDKEAMVCKEIIAELVTPREESMYDFDKPLLLIKERTFRVIDWSVDKILHAIYETPPANVELRISIQDALAERHWRETKARGAHLSNPKYFENWILE